METLSLKAPEWKEYFNEAETKYLKDFGFYYIGNSCLSGNEYIARLEVRDVRTAVAREKYRFPELQGISDTEIFHKMSASKVNHIYRCYIARKYKIGRNPFEYSNENVISSYVRPDEVAFELGKRLRMFSDLYEKFERESSEEFQAAKAASELQIARERYRASGLF